MDQHQLTVEVRQEITQVIADGKNLNDVRLYELMSPKRA
jgi:hypothetical protein